MKRVLVIDESDLFREYLEEKLESTGEIEVHQAVNGLDAVAKIRGIVPDLVIVDYHLTRRSCKEVLAEKRANPNTSKAPVIITAAKLDRARIMELLQHDVRKVFTKPVRIDALLSVISSILGVRFDVDKTPAVLEARVNDNIIFVEASMGINLDKVEMLRFKISELTALYGISDPRVVVMMSDMPLSFADGPNLERLIDNVLSASRSRPRHVRVLTSNAFVRDFLSGQKKYEGIESCTSLQAALDGLVSPDASPSAAGNRMERIIAAPAEGPRPESFQMRFAEEAARAFAVEDGREAGKGLAVAVVDDDPTIVELVRTTFQNIAASVTSFEDGDRFLENLKGGAEYDIVFLDLVMPNVGGFDVLASMEAWDIDVPVIVLSAVSQRESIVKAFQAGVKSYLVKPLNPASIVKKAAETLRANF